MGLTIKVTLSFETFLILALLLVWKRKVKKFKNKYSQSSLIMAYNQLSFLL